MNVIMIKTDREQEAEHQSICFIPIGLFNEKQTCSCFPGNLLCDKRMR